MLSRFSYDPDRATFPEGRQGKIENLMSPRQVVRLDPWENDDCLRCLQVAFSTGMSTVNGWNGIPGNLSSIWQGTEGSQMVRVLHDPDSGFIYYRRPIDIERQMIWNANKDFRINAKEWWDNDKMNQWWKETYPGIYWFKLIRDVVDPPPANYPRGAKCIVEACDPQNAEAKFTRTINEGYCGITSFGKNLFGPYDSEVKAKEAQVAIADQREP